jgi:phage shock protein C
MYCCNCGKELEDIANFCSVCGTAKPQARPPMGDPNLRKPLSRIRAGRKIAGVCGGVARYFDLDVTLIRVLWIVLTIFPPLLPGIVAYVVCWIAMPEDPQTHTAPPDGERSPSFSA